jgi:type II secretory pathway component PulF
VILQKEASSAAAKQKWKEVHDQVVDGLSLAEAMGKSPDTFPRVYVAMVEAGEAGGFLDVVLAQIAEFQSREKDLKSKVLTAMLYPCILLVLALGILVLLMTFFIPKFQKIFDNMHTALPLITQIIIGTSHVMRSYGLIVAAALVGLVFMLRAWFVSEKGRRTWENIILKTPLVGPLIAQFAMARFCRMLGTLLGAGVPLVHGLNVARRSIGNQILVDAVTQTIERVQQGGRLGQSLADCKMLFPSSVVEMISVAEESGKLDGELVRLASSTENDLDRNLKTAVAFAEPLLLFLIAGFIGTIFIGMLLPVLSMSQYIK